MNNQLITKIIHTDDATTCPELTYENPLIDRNVAGALVRSFVKILRVSKQDSNLNNNLRYSVLANIRKLCRTEPENHFEMDENFTKSLSEVYIDNLKSLHTNESTDCVERTLDEFLIRKMKGVDVYSSHQFSMNSEIIQALLNLSENYSDNESIARNVLHWDMSVKKNSTLVKHLWTKTKLVECLGTKVCDNISIKMTSEIETALLTSCHRLLTEPNLKLEELFSGNSFMMDLIYKCTISSECFEICIRILNYLFIYSNYNRDIQIFVSKFIENVKTQCPKCISILYPAHLAYIAVLLDIDLETLPPTFKSKYVDKTLVHLKNLQNESDCDLVLILSHFPHWFPIYIH